MSNQPINVVERASAKDHGVSIHMSARNASRLLALLETRENNPRKLNYNLDAVVNALRGAGINPFPNYDFIITPR